MGLKRFLLAGLLVIGITAAAILLFLAGDHDDEDRIAAPAPYSSASGADGRAASARPGATKRLNTSDITRLE